jgi:deoxycytidylate deaminase
MDSFCKDTTKTGPLDDVPLAIKTRHVGKTRLSKKLSSRDVVKNALKLKREAHRSGLILARHAEENALDRYRSVIGVRGRKKMKIRKLHLVVIRIDCRDNITESKPCSHCVEVMRNFGIRKVTYSNKAGELITELLANIISHPSVGYQSAARAMRVIDEMLAYYQGIT